MKPSVCIHTHIHREKEGGEGEKKRERRGGGRTRMWAFKSFFIRYFIYVSNIILFPGFPPPRKPPIPSLDTPFPVMTELLHSLFLSSKYVVPPSSLPLFLSSSSFCCLMNHWFAQGHLHDHRFGAVHWSLLGSRLCISLKTIKLPSLESIHSQ